MLYLYLLPQSPKDLAFAFISLFVSYYLLRFLFHLLVPSPSSPKRRLSHSKSSVASQHTGSQTIPAAARAHHSLVTSPLQALAALGNMIIAPLVARPVPVPEPPSTTLLDRTAAVIESVTAQPKLQKPESPWPVKQPYDAYLVLDVEATCQEGTDFNWPNEIIVCGEILAFLTSNTCVQADATR